MSLGFALAGFRIAGGIDSNERAMETHAHHFGGHDKPIELSEDFGVDEALHALGVNRVDVLVGGPPCQGFARVGKGKILSLLRPTMKEEELADYDDPRNSLYRQYLRFVDKLKPEFVVMENVPDMYLHQDGEVVRAIICDLDRLGYGHAKPLLLSAADYGVPQTRQRLFIVANRVGLPVAAPIPVTERHPVTLKQAIRDLPRVRPEESADELPYDLPRDAFAYARRMRQGVPRHERGIIYDHVVRQYNAQDQEAFSILEEGGRYVDLPGHLRRYRSDIFDDKYHKLYWSKPSWTVTAHIAKDGYKYIHPDRLQARTITAREAARIQSFPDWFRFAGHRTSRLKQIGNAVPPLLARAIGEVVREQIRSLPGVRG